MSEKNISFFSQVSNEFLLGRTFGNSVLLTKITGLSLITFHQNGMLPGH